MTKPAFVLHIQAVGVRGEVRLNDAPILPLHLSNEQDAYVTVSEWVIDGDNTVSVHVDDSDARARLHVALCPAQIGDDPVDIRHNMLVSVDWPPAPLGVDVPAVPAIPPVLAATGPARHSWGAWSWQRSPPFEATVATATAVTAYVQDLHARLAAGDIDTLIASSQIKITELTPVYDMSAAAGETRMRQMWGHLTAQADWELAPLDPEDLDLRLRCEGQLVEPVTLEGRPVLRQARAIDGTRWSLPIFIGRTNWEVISGYLTILR